MLAAVVSWLDATSGVVVVGASVASGASVVVVGAAVSSKPA